MKLVELKYKLSNYMINYSIRKYEKAKRKNYNKFEKIYNSNLVIKINNAIFNFYSKFYSKWILYQCGESALKSYASEGYSFDKYCNSVACFNCPLKKKHKRLKCEKKYNKILNKLYTPEEEE